MHGGLPKSLNDWLGNLAVFDQSLYALIAILQNIRHALRPRQHPSSFITEFRHEFHHICSMFAGIRHDLQSAWPDLAQGHEGFLPVTCTNARELLSKRLNCFFPDLLAKLAHDI